MSTFLFTAHASAMGHLNPLLTIAQQMQSEGHTCIFAGHTRPNTEQVISTYGFRLIKIRPSLKNLGLLFLPLTSGFFETFYASLQFFAGLDHYANAIGKILDNVQPDTVVTDFSFFGSGLAAEVHNIPYVVLYHAGLSFKGDGIPPFGSGLPIGGAWGRQGEIYQRFFDFADHHVATTIARMRARLGVPAGMPYSLTCPASAWLTLVLTAEAIEAPRYPLPPTFFFIGPCFSGRKSAQSEGFPFEQFSQAQPKIYVSLGTVFNKKPQVFHKIIQAFAETGYQLIVSAGGAFDALRAQLLPQNVLLFPRVPQVEVLAKVDAVISHGGNNTTNETLAAGKPLLVMPVGGEQGDNEEIRTKVSHLIEESEFRQKAQRCADALALTQGPVTASQFIQHVAHTRQPLQRPDGYPLTVTRSRGWPWEVGQLEF
jgi:MGT family glycosyltransferase